MHSVRIDPDSRTGRALQKQSTRVKSHHHQGVDRLGADLVAVAWATDNTIEAIERNGDAYLVRTSEREHFGEAIAALEAEGYELRVTGPWPPYSFTRLT